MRSATCLGFAVTMGLLGPVPALAQGSPAAHIGVFAGPVLVRPEANVRLTRLLGVRARAVSLDMFGAPARNVARREGAATLLFYGAIVDVYPLGDGLRVSAGWENDASYNEALLSNHGNDGETVLSEGAVPSFTIGYGRDVRGPLHVAVDGGVIMRDRQREKDAGAPRLNNAVSRVYPVVRFSLSRAF